MKYKKRGVKINPANPFCIECKSQMVTISSLSYKCKQCNYTIVKRRTINARSNELVYGEVFRCYLCGGKLISKGFDWMCVNCGKYTRKSKFYSSLVLEDYTFGEVMVI